MWNFRIKFKIFERFCTLFGRIFVFRTTNILEKKWEQLIFIRPLGRGRGATSAADHRGRFLSAPLAAPTSYRGVEEGGKFQKQHAPVRAPAEMLPMQCAHAR